MTTPMKYKVGDYIVLKQDVEVNKFERKHIYDIIWNNEEQVYKYYYKNFSEQQGIVSEDMIECLFDNVENLYPKPKYEINQIIDTTYKKNVHIYNRHWCNINNCWNYKYDYGLGNTSEGCVLEKNIKKNGDK